MFVKRQGGGKPARLRCRARMHHAAGLVRRPSEDGTKQTRRSLIGESRDMQPKRLWGGIWVICGEKAMAVMKLHHRTENVSRLGSLPRIDP
jgi:hypothetical protein